MRPNNAIRYLGFSFCIGFCTLCIVFFASALFFFVFLVLFLFSLSIGVFVFLRIRMAKMPLGPVLSIIASHLTLPHFGSEMLLSHPPSSLTFRFENLPAFPPKFPFEDALLASAGASASQRASPPVSCVRREVFGVRSEDAGVISDV